MVSVCYSHPRAESTFHLKRRTHPTHPVQTSKYSVPPCDTGGWLVGHEYKTILLPLTREARSLRLVEIMFLFISKPITRARPPGFSLHRSIVLRREHRRAAAHKKVSIFYLSFSFLLLSSKSVFLAYYFLLDTGLANTK